jgi:hypothetical protein
MVMSREHNAGQNHNMKTGNKSFERVEDFKYSGTVLTNRSSIHEEIKSRLQSGNACYPSVQNLLFYSLLSKSIKLEIYRTIILSLVLYGCETGSLPLREEHRLRVFENKVVKKCLGLRGRDNMGCTRLHNEDLCDLYSSPNVWAIKSRGMRRAGHVACTGDRTGAHIVLVGKPEGKRQLERTRCRRDDNIKMSLQGVGLAGLD